MTGLTIISSISDEGGPRAFARELLLPRNVLLESLTCVNQGADACYIQLFDSPRKLAIPITDTDATTMVITAPAHGLVTGDAITLTSIAGLTAGYAQVIDVDTFYVFATRQGALDASIGAVPEEPSSDDDTGSVTLTSNVTPPVAEEYPLAGASSAPSNVLSFTQARFRRGLYVRAVTDIAGSTLISEADVKFTPRYRTGDLANSLSYED